MPFYRKIRYNIERFFHVQKIIMERSCMMADIWDFFENMDELVYVADMDTYDMVYMNRRAMAQYALTSPEQYQNHKCYELLQSCSSPCAMCTNSKLCPGEFFE